MRQNRDQQNSEYGHFLRSDCSIKNTRLAIAMENIRSTGGYILQKKKPKATHPLSLITVLKLNSVEGKSIRDLL